MFKIISLMFVQCLLLTSGQVLLKAGLQKVPKFGWTKEFWGSLILNWEFAACVVFLGLASLMWVWILKKYPFNIAYPLSSISYVLGMLAAMFFLHESVSVTRWIGVACIVLGCILIAK